MKDILRMTGIIYDSDGACGSDKVSSGDATFRSDVKTVLDELGAFLTARAKKNSGVLFSADIRDAFDGVFGFDNYDTSASNTSSTEDDFPDKKYRLAIEDDSVAKKVRLYQLQPGEMFDWLGNPTMVVVDRLGHRHFADLRVGYFQEFDDLHTLVRPLEATLTIDK